MGWSAEQDARLRQLAEAGHLSTARMAGVINGEFGTSYTRSAVIGRSHRMGIKLAASHSKSGSSRVRNADGEIPRRATQLSKRPRIKIIHPESGGPKEVKSITRLIPSAHGHFRLHNSTETSVGPLRSVEVEPLHFSLADLQHGQCRYPYGDGPFTFCGCRTEPDRPYCEPHQKLCGGTPLDEHRRRSAAQKLRHARIKGFKRFPVVAA